MDLIDLKRNDVNGAIDFYVDAKKRGTWEPALSTILIQLQDDPTELMDRIYALEHPT